MKRLLLALLALVGMAAWVSPVLAQPSPFGPAPFGQAPFGRPAVSPYINLARPGTNPAIEYYGIVRPQLGFYNTVQGLQQDVYGNQQAIIATGFGLGQGQMLPPTTGVPANFMTQNRFFMTRGNGRLGAGAAPGQASPGFMTPGRNIQPATQPLPPTTGAMPAYR
jgi:hypothetical protein